MRKQQNPYQIRLLVLATGERFPLIVERATGVPLFKPTLYVLTMLRTKNHASATIYQHCLAIMILTLFLRFEKIDLDERMSSGRLLSLPEIESLVRPCQIHLDCMNCDEQVCIKGDRVREENLRRQREETRQLLVAAEEGRQGTQARIAGLHIKR